MIDSIFLFYSKVLIWYFILWSIISYFLWLADSTKKNSKQKTQDDDLGLGCAIFVLLLIPYGILSGIWGINRYINFDPSIHASAPPESTATVSSSTTHAEVLPSSVNLRLHKEYIRNEALNPNSVVFPWSNGEIKEVGANYTISSYFDATNGFGATVRTHYTATVDHSGNVISVVYY